MIINKNTGRPIFYKGIDAVFTAPTTTSRKASGYFASFNNVDSDQDVIREGSFRKSISERGPSTTSNRQIKYLHQHRTVEIAGPLHKLYEDSVGLGFEGDVEKTPLGDVIIERYANGTYKEHSIGFQYVWDKCNWIQIPAKAEDGTIGMLDVFECKELELFEGSVVTFGANSNTPFTGFKGSHEDLIKSLQSELNFLIKHAPNYDYELQIRALFAKQISLAEQLAVRDTKEESKPKPTIDLTYLTNHFNLNK